VPLEIINEVRRTRRITLPDELYAGKAAHPVDAFDMEAADAAMKLTVSSESLVNPPACPYCSNKYWAPCGDCERIFCLGGDGRSVCPWCGHAATYGKASEAFDVGRSLG
jgi:uncharacterized Zn-finger protein